MLTMWTAHATMTSPRCTPTVDDNGIHVLEGHHNTNYEGEHFHSSSSTFDQSDVRTAVGKYPGLFGFNLAWVVGDNVKDILPQAKYAAAAGAVLQLYWEAGNPVTGGSANDLKGSPAKEVLPGGTANAKWVGVSIAAAARCFPSQRPWFNFIMFRSHDSSDGNSALRPWCCTSHLENAVQQKTLRAV